jgi:predicted DNA-binding transcriptional regulator AlpA
MYIAVHHNREGFVDSLMTPREVAELFGMSVQTLSNWRATKRFDLPYIKVGRRVMYQRSDVLAFINSRRVSFAEGE